MEKKQSQRHVYGFIVDAVAPQDINLKTHVTLCKKKVVNDFWDRKKDRYRIVSQPGQYVPFGGSRILKMGKEEHKRWEERDGLYYQELYKEKIKQLLNIEENTPVEIERSTDALFRKIQEEGGVQLKDYGIEKECCFKIEAGLNLEEECFKAYFVLAGSHYGAINKALEENIRLLQKNDTSKNIKDGEIEKIVVVKLSDLYQFLGVAQEIELTQNVKNSLAQNPSELRIDWYQTMGENIANLLRMNDQIVKFYSDLKSSHARQLSVAPDSVTFHDAQHFYRYLSVLHRAYLDRYYMVRVSPGVPVVYPLEKEIKNAEGAQKHNHAKEIQLLAEALKNLEIEQEALNKLKSGLKQAKKELDEIKIEIDQLNK